MLKEEVAFENYFDLYTPDDIETVSLALAQSVPPGDYEMKVTVTNGGSVLQRCSILVHVMCPLPCTTSSGKTTIVTIFAKTDIFAHKLWSIFSTFK